jgi:hypothetical protein
MGEAHKYDAPELAQLPNHMRARCMTLREIYVIEATRLVKADIVFKCRCSAMTATYLTKGPIAGLVEAMLDAANNGLPQAGSDEITGYRP